MRFLFSEYRANYRKYRFPYQVYALKEDSDEYADLYALGLLPSRIAKDLYYLARGVRVDLVKFEPSSENRRIKRKTKYLEVEMIGLGDFDYDFTIGKLGKDFYEKRFGKGVMSANKIKWLFTSGAMTHVLKYNDKEKDKVVGYCLVISDKNMLHYAYPFYDVSYFEKNAGMGMMLSAIELAKENGLSHVYLGTCYTESSLYKLQFEGVEYFNGFEWSGDTEKLKEVVREREVQSGDFEPMGSEPTMQLKEGHWFEKVDDKIELINKIKSDESDS